ncbi:MAG: DUF975 family protein [Lachnospiraceae bacterium]|nr:DUF975 family protein [Lachnospiraceae bacterium]
METEHASFRTSAQLKAQARTVLLGRYGLTISATVIFLVIYMTVFGFVSPPPDTTLTLIWLEITSVVLRLFSGLFASGLAFLYLNLVYGQPASVGDLFHAFKEMPLKAIALQIVFVLAALAANLPSIIYELTAGDNYRLLVALILMAAVPVLTFVLTLPFSQVYFLLQDFPERDVPSLLRASARLMNGHKLRLFLLTLSFLPLFLVCVVTLFLPMLWLYSYYEAALAVFYKDLMEGGRHGSA